MARKFFKKNRLKVSLPDLIEIQKNSYDWLFRVGIKELLGEISPIDDFTGKNLTLKFEDYHLDDPKFDEMTSRAKNLTYKAALKCRVALYNKITKKKTKSDILLGDFPLMTPRGTFVINGVERVVVSQIIRSFGVIFTSEISNNKKVFGAKVIPSRGAWLELETSSRDVIYVKIDRKRKIPITTFLKTIGLEDDNKILKTFSDVDTHSQHKYIETTLSKDPSKNKNEAVVEVYKRIRPGDLATPDSAKTFLETMFFNPKRYDIGRVGRYKINQRLGLDVSQNIQNRVLRLADMIEVIKEIIRLNNNPDAKADDIDHLKNRRVRAVGELVQGRLRVGLLRMERIVRDRMSVSDLDTVMPSQLINSRPITAVLQEFFASSQLSQFMNQTNPLSELEHKRTLSATGPGGLSRERAGFEVRDVHESHYGRICPISTPDGPNIGLVGYLASHARVNEYGFIESPFFKVETKKGQRPRVTNKIVYLNAAKGEHVTIAPSSVKIDERGYFKKNKITVRKYGKLTVDKIENVDYVDITSKQIVSITTSLIPFVEHNDAARASMGSNMQRQAVPLVKAQSPIVGTGMEKDAALYSGQVVLAEESGKVIRCSADNITIIDKNGKKRDHKLQKFVRSNQATCINQKPIISIGDKVSKGQIIADGPSTDNGELALGANVLVGFMSWGGGNYEDAIIISERLVKEDYFSSIHIEKYSIEIRDTRLGPELITRDIPNVSEEALANLDKQGIVRIGAEVKDGDILVGKISPKGETELSAEEKLLRAIFGEKAKDVKDTSLRLAHGQRGKIVNIKIFSKDAGDEIPTGVYKIVEIAVAQFRRILVGDKLAGRHGNKGIISKILPESEMPFMADGTPIDIILNPLGVVSRMNLGQILETHLGWVAQKLGYKAASPIFEGVAFDQIKSEFKKANLPEDGKTQLYDGRTGEPFDHKTTVGYIYMLKLIHMVDDKMHARSIGPYSMVTQQPLGGKAQFGGQRFGEMEVWALEGYGAAYSLQEMLTIKSDDVLGRSRAYESIIRGEQIQKPQIPASFYVLTKELQSLGLAIDMIQDKKKTPFAKEEKMADEAISGRKKTKSTKTKKEIPMVSLKASQSKVVDKMKSVETEKIDEQTTELMVEQEKHPPQATKEEIAEVEKGRT